MELDNDYYSETPLRIIRVEEKPEDHAEAADESTGDDTPSETVDLADDDGDHNGDTNGEPIPTRGRMTFVSRKRLPATAPA